MKKFHLLLTGALFVISASVSAQMNPQFNPAQDPVAWGNPNAAVPGTVYVSRYGYWRNQPVKMAYWTGLPHYRVPQMFHLADANGKIVYTGRPVWMPDPTNVMVPIGFYYPGLKMYALNFSGFDQSGRYYIEVPGYRTSPEFNIRGYIPGEMVHIPGELTFERDAGMLPPPVYQHPGYIYPNGPVPR